jgi:CheY-like chemotaxis protein
MKIISLNSLLIETANFALRGSNVDCRFTIQPDLWQANVDEGQIGQVISNLVINARQAMPKGGTITITAENIVLTGRQSLGRTLPLDDGDYIRIMVADRGTGIPAEHLDRVFDPYFTTKQTGSGLGLAICYSIIRNHGGHISVESKTGEGTTFYVYLPATHEQAAADPKAAVQTQVPARSRLLIMDDEGSVCDIMGRLLDHLGYKDVAFAPDGHKAFELYRAALKTGRPFDAVILDFTVPGGMGGAETLQKLLEIDPGVRAIISSGYAGETVMAEYRQHGFRAALAKPFTLDELRQTLARVLGAD